MQPEGEFAARPAEPAAAPVVEAAPKEKKVKGGKAVKVLCVLFALIAAGLGGYICYDKVIAKNDSAKNEPTDCVDAIGAVDEDESEEPKKAVERTGFSLNNHAIDFYVTASGDVYLTTEQVQYGGGERISWEVANSDEIGKAGTYELNKDELRFRPWSDENEKQTFSIEGIKLNLDNIVYVSQFVTCGQQVMEEITYLVDADGNASTVTVDAPYTGHTVLPVTLKKNVETGVAALMNVDVGSGLGSILVYRDGSQKYLCEI